MSGLPRPDTLDMSCPLLDKLAPETRILIYEYVLSFETPVQHVTKMRPFLPKLTGGGVTSQADSTESEDEYEWEDIDLQSTRAELESRPSTKATGKPEPFRTVNTSILTASKLIYTEAIDVFYKRNIISIDLYFCDLAALESPRTTDLSLAEQVIVKIDMRRGHTDTTTGRKISRSQVMRDAIKIATVGLPAIFSNLISTEIYINIDAMHIFKMAGLILRSQNCDAVLFEGIGNLAASWSDHPDLKFLVQDKSTMERWATQPTDVPPPPIGRVRTFEISADLMYRAWLADPQGVYATYARQIFDGLCDVIVPKVFRAVGQDSYEFWTVVDGCLSFYQRRAPRPS